MISFLLFHFSWDKLFSRLFTHRTDTTIQQGQNARQVVKTKQPHIHTPSVLSFFLSFSLHSVWLNVHVGEMQKEREEEELGHLCAQREREKEASVFEQQRQS